MCLCVCLCAVSTCPHTYRYTHVKPSRDCSRADCDTFSLTFSHAHTLSIFSLSLSLPLSLPVSLPLSLSHSVPLSVSRVTKTDFEVAKLLTRCNVDGHFISSQGTSRTLIIHCVSVPVNCAASDDAAPVAWRRVTLPVRTAPLRERMSFPCAESGVEVR